MRNTDEGLGLSLVLYFGVMAACLVAIAMPIYWANSGTVYQNPEVTAGNVTPGGPAYATDSRSQFPLAVLSRTPVVDAATLAQVNARTPPPQKTVRTVSRPPRRTYAQAPDTDAPADRQARQPFFFSLF